MKAYTTENIRNLAVIGHGDAGKTQLIASLLHVAGTTNRWGRVDEGTTVTDYEDDSIARKVTLNNNFAHLEYKDTKINFIDTPGYAAFVSHARPALRVADCALVVVGNRTVAAENPNNGFVFIPLPQELTVLPRIRRIKRRFAKRPMAAPSRQHPDIQAEFFGLFDDEIYVTKIGFVRLCGIALHERQIAIRVRYGQAAELCQYDGLNDCEAFLRAIAQVQRRFLAVQPVKQLPGRVAQIEKRRAVSMLQKAAVGGDL